MIKKLAKLKYLPNNFEIIQRRRSCNLCISGKIIKLEELNYWNVDLQEAYYSYVEARKKEKIIKLIYFHLIVRPNPLIWIFKNHFSNKAFNFKVIFSIVSSVYSTGL